MRPLTETEYDTKTFFFIVATPRVRRYSDKIYSDPLGFPVAMPQIDIYPNNYTNGIWQNMSVHCVSHAHMGLGLKISQTS